MTIFLPRMSESVENAPLALQGWLGHQHSMTDKLRWEAGEASLAILSQSWRPTSWWDRHVLNLDPQTVMEREILMSAHAIPCWYARTIIPENTWNNHGTIFRRLKQESLGDIIFSEQRINRTQLITYQLDKHCLEYYWNRSFNEKGSGIFWARLSVLTIDLLFPFFLIEILLPGLLEKSP